MEVRPGEKIKRALHFTIVDEARNVINDEFGPGNKLFWFKNEEKKWPECVNEVFGQTSIG